MRGSIVRLCWGGVVVTTTRRICCDGFFQSSNTNAFSTRISRCPSRIIKKNARFALETRSKRNLNRSLLATAASTCIASDDESLCTTSPKATAAAVVDTTRRPTYLVVGDGDLSFSAQLARQLVNNENSNKNSSDNIQLIATVLEDEVTHRAVYRNSKCHTQTILAAGESSSSSSSSAQVCFGVDATQLARYFGGGGNSSRTSDNNEQTTKTTSALFDRIIFNFPHWRGKSNTRYNRELLNNFLRSACQVLKKHAAIDTSIMTATSRQQQQEQEGGGEIHVTLCHGQGGTEASSVKEWRQSWMASIFAAEHGLLLKRLETFAVQYDLSSHRGADRAFSVGTKEPLTYVFGFPCGGGSAAAIIDKHLQVACRHELRLELPLDLSNYDDDDEEEKEEKKNKKKFRNITQCPCSTDELINGSIIPDMVQQVVAQFPGIRAETPLRDVITTTRSGHHLLVFLVVYAGEAKPLTRAEADRIRATLEQTAMDTLGLTVAKKDRMVSRPFPYPLLEALIEEYNANAAT